MYDYDPYPIPDSTDDGPEVALIRFFGLWPEGRIPHQPNGETPAGRWLDYFKRGGL